MQKNKLEQNNDSSDHLLLMCSRRFYGGNEFGILDEGAMT